MMWQPYTRITPACAGNTDEDKLTQYRTMGSPPRMREILVGFHKKTHNFRITPAYAGNTHNELPEHSHHQDHPRVCGKYVAIRGHCLMQQRITLADARNTETPKILPTQPPDHPRVCGKYSATFTRNFSKSGSPLLTQEIPANWNQRFSDHRITPAYAGNTMGILKSL